jgi:hypothetical protein
MSMIDHCVQAFFRSARSANTVGQLNFRLLNFDAQQHAIAVCNALTSKLHPLVQAVTNPNKRTLDQVTPDESTDRSTPARAAINPTPDPAFKIRVGYKYATLLPTSMVRTAPKFNGTSVCCRWHIKGICVQNCERSATHVTLPPDVRSKLSSFLARAYTAAGPPGAATHPTAHPQPPPTLTDASHPHPSN